MNDRDLLMIKYLNQFKNITKAANALFITQPALTARIRVLERELDTKLLHSSNKGIAFTATGLELVAFSEDAVLQIDNLRKRLKAIDRKNAELIRVAAPYIICYYYMPQVIREFKKLCPQAQFQVQSTPSSHVVSLLNQNLYDFGFLRNDFGWEENESVPLAVDHIAAVSMTPFEFSDLPDMKRVAYTTDGYYMRMLELWWNNNFKQPPKIDVLVNSLDLCKEMVYRGLGFGLLPSVFLPECPDACHYILNDKEGKPIERHTRLIYKKANIKGRLAKRFLQFLQEKNFAEFFQSKGR